MAYDNNLYDGSSAYKIDQYNEYNRKAQERQDEQHENEKRQNALNLKKILIITLIVSVIAGAYLWIDAKHLQTSAQVTKLTNELEMTKARNTQIAFEISSETDLKEIGEVVTTEFGMQTPEGYQNVYVNVVQSDYTKMACDSGESAGFIDSMIKNLKSFLAYIG